VPTAPGRVSQSLRHSRKEHELLEGVGMSPRNASCASCNKPVHAPFRPQLIRHYDRVLATLRRRRAAESVDVAQREVDVGPVHISRFGVDQRKRRPLRVCSQGVFIVLLRRLVRCFLGVSLRRIASRLVASYQPAMASLRCRCRLETTFASNTHSCPVFLALPLPVQNFLTVRQVCLRTICLWSRQNF